MPLGNPVTAGDKAGMDNYEPPHRLRWPRALVRSVGYPLLAAVLYLLSSGPMYWLLMWRSDAVNRWYGRVYAPVDWMVYRMEPGSFLTLYLAWWYTLPGGADDRFKRDYLAPDNAP
jgi:hypothetical protein